jgi:hypothetical protein
MASERTLTLCKGPFPTAVGVGTASTAAFEGQRSSVPPRPSACSRPLRTDAKC